MTHSRRWCALLAVLLLLTVTSCGGGKPDPAAAQYQARLKKAAGVTLFRIVCVKDLWIRTTERTFMDDSQSVEGKVTPAPGGLVTVELTGPQLVDYLKRLYDDGFGAREDPLAVRMYNGIGPVVDKIQEGATPAGKIPEVRIDDPVGSSSSSPTAGTAKATPSPS